MKIKKLLVLAGTAVMLMACGGNTKSTTPATSTEATTSTETTSSQATSTSSAPVSVASSSASSAAPASSSKSSAATSTATSSASTQADRYAVSYRDTMAGADKTKVADTVKAYTNGETFDGFVTTLVNEGSNQVASVDDSVKGTFKVLQIGSSSGEGALTFTFSVNVKSVILSVENYNKSYVNGQTGEPGSSQDTTSKLYVNSDSNVIDLAATAGKPTVKTETVEINSKTLKIYNKAGKNRVFVNAITFVLK